MNKYLGKYGLMVIIGMGLLGLGNMSDTLIGSILPKPAKEVGINVVVDVLLEALENKEVRSAFGEIVKEENEVFSTKLDVLYYDSADNWVRSINKQYGKIESGASNLYWEDVEYILGKWPLMPGDYRKPPLVAKMLYIQSQYDSHMSGN